MVARVVGEYKGALLGKQIALRSSFGRPFIFMRPSLDFLDNCNQEIETYQANSILGPFGAT